MFKRHSRVPALLILALSVGVCVVYLRVWGKAAALDSIQDLEKRISAGKVDLDTWRQYGQRLCEARRFKDAAKAYRSALEIAPADRIAREGMAMSLAQAASPGHGDDALYEFLHHLIDNNQARMVQELFKKPEIDAYLSQERFSRLLTDATNQAID